MKLNSLVTVVVLCCFLLLFSSAVSADDSALSIVASEGNEDDIATVVASDAEEQSEPPTSDEVFVATNEWQVVKPGQHIPAGLHVRLNLQTGEKTAKLMDEPATKKDAITVDGKPYSFSEIKETLKNIKNEIPIE
uniref:Uncharacterized protein n=1 Tax=Plectus sambesii TaxID=2011161 RepID=A0A914UK92_9BILA